MSCVNEKFFNILKEKHQVEIQPSTTSLSNENQMAIQLKAQYPKPFKLFLKSTRKHYTSYLKPNRNVYWDLTFLEQISSMHYYGKEK